MATIQAVHEFTDAWRWPEDVERFIREQLPEGRVLNVSAGKSPLGDVKLDADATLQDNAIPGDMYQLPFKDASFEGVIGDPPWRSVDRFQRHQLFYELVRVTKPNGIIIHNATWVPNSKEVEKVGEYRRVDNDFSDASVITVFRRHKDQATLEAFAPDEEIAISQPDGGLSVRSSGRGMHAEGQLVIDGPEGQVIATKRYDVPHFNDVTGETARVRERIDYQLPDAGSPQRAVSTLPEREGTVRIPADVLGDPDAVASALGHWFVDDPQLEYQAVRRALGTQVGPPSASGGRDSASPSRV